MKTSLFFIVLISASLCSCNQQLTRAIVKGALRSEKTAAPAPFFPPEEMSAVEILMLEDSTTLALSIISVVEILPTQGSGVTYRLMTEEGGWFELSVSATGSATLQNHAGIITLQFGKMQGGMAEGTVISSEGEFTGMNYVRLYSP